MVGKAVSMAGNLFIAGPVWFPILPALGGGIGPQLGTNYMYNAVGLTKEGQIDQGFLISNILPRDAALVGLGLFTKWLAKRVR